MVLRKTLAPHSTETAESQRPASAAVRGGDPAPSFQCIGLLVAACMTFALSTAPVHAQENNPDETDITYEDIDPPDGGTENNPDESDIIYEDFPDDLPEGEGGNDPLPIGGQPPGAVPEPATLALLLAGGAGALLMGRRRSRQG